MTENKCALCGMAENPDHPTFPRGGKPDPCLGVLPGVIHACCGHGELWRAYLVIANATPGTIVSSLKKYKRLGGQDAIDYFTSHGVGPKVVPSDASAIVKSA